MSLSALPQETFKAVQTFLWRMLTQCPDPLVALSVSRHLAAINGKQMLRMLNNHNEGDQWRPFLASEVARRLQYLRQLALGEATLAVVSTESGADGAPGSLTSEQWCCPPVVLAGGAAGNSGTAAVSGGPGALPPLPPPVLCERVLRYLTMLAEDCQVWVGARHCTTVLPSDARPACAACVASPLAKCSYQNINKLS